MKRYEKITRCFPVVFCRSVKFQFKLDDSVWGVVPKSYTFTSAMDLTLFGRRLYQPFKFTLVNPLASILAGKDDAVKWYTDHTNPTATSEKSYYDKPTPYSDFDFSGEYLGSSTSICEF